MTTPNGDEIFVRQALDEEMPAVYEVVKLLRTQLSLDVFLERLALQQHRGYLLYVAVDVEIVGVIGFRPVVTLARGHHLHVDDLVVRSSDRFRGIGATLMRFAESYALDHGLGAVFLDSRQDVIGFYERIGYEFHTATLMRKHVKRGS